MIAKLEIDNQFKVESVTIIYNYFCIFYSYLKISFAIVSVIAKCTN